MTDRPREPFDVDGEVDAELAHYVELRTRELEAGGMSRDEALREARARFGDRGRIREECVEIQRRRRRRQRRRQSMTGTGKDVLHALRGLRRTPVVTVAALTTLALGIGANTAVFSVVRSVLLRPLPFERPEELVALHETRGPDATPASVAPANYLDWRARVEGLSSVAAFTVRPMSLMEGDAPVRVQVGVVSGNFLATLGIEPILGRTFDPALDLAGTARELVLGDDLWRGRFGADPAVVGRAVRIDDEPYTVVGVARAESALLRGAALWMRSPWEVPPIPGFTGDITQVRSAWYFDVVGRRAPGVALEAVRSELDAVSAGLRGEYPRTNAEAGIRAMPLKEDLVGSARSRLLVLLGAVAMVLLAVAANVASLSLVRAEARKRDFALRVALGAGRRRLVRMVAIEGVALAAAGCGLGVALAAAVLPALRGALPAELPRRSEVTMDGGVLLFSVAASAVVCLLFALAPAIMAGRAEPARALAGRGDGGGRGGTRLRSALVVAEVTLGVVLTVGTGLLVRSLRAMDDVDPGYRAEGLVTLSVSLPGGDVLPVEETRRRWSDARRVLSERPDVERVGLGITTPARGGPEAGLVVVGRDDSEPADRSVVWHPTSPGYLEALEVPLLRGRILDEDDRANSPHVAVVSETLARRFFASGDPLGTLVTIGLDAGHAVRIEIVGVVGDTRNRGPTREPRPVLYRPIQQAGGFGRGTMSVVARGTSDSGALLASLTDAVRAAEPTALVYGATAGGDLDAAYFAERRFVSNLLGAFALLAVVLAAIGLYGVTAHSVGRRRAEIGIRKAIGATRGRVWLSVLTGGMVPAVIGLGVGLAVAGIAARALGAFLFQVGTVDPPTYAVVSAVLLGVAVLALAGPAWTAVRIDPASSIRGE